MLECGWDAASKNSTISKLPFHQPIPQSYPCGEPALHSQHILVPISTSYGVPAVKVCITCQVCGTLPSCTLVGKHREWRQSNSIIGHGLMGLSHTSKGHVSLLGCLSAVQLIGVEF